MDPNKIYHVWLSDCTDLSCRARLLLLSLFGNAEAVFKASDEDLLQCFHVYPGFPKNAENSRIFRRDLSAAEAEMRRAEDFGAELLTVDDPQYPPFLGGIDQPPTVLYYKGDISVISSPGIAVVGTRRCSPYGKWAAEEIAKRIAVCGASVISGMAEGIDGAAHRGCLAGGGKTAAVFGTGIDVCFPESNRRLYERLQEDQLILTEYPPGTRGSRAFFPARNRIISGLSRAVIVVEAALKSGSLITAGLALEQGREVLAVPGNINQPNSVGVNRLIADGAVPVMSLDDIPSLLGLETLRSARAMARTDRAEKQLLAVIRENNGQPAELIVHRAGLTASEGAALLSGLELKGLITVHGYQVFLS